MTDRELMQQALEALDEAANVLTWDGFQKAAEALRERLAQPEQEPVAWFDKEFNSVRWRADLRNRDLDDQQPLYTAPQRREWQGLTGEEIEFIYADTGYNDIQMFARAIEAKLREKNA